MNDYQLFHPLTSDLMTDYSLSSDHFISCVSITVNYCNCCSAFDYNCIPTLNMFLKINSATIIN